MPLHPGDPLTPGVGATEDAKRLDAARTPTTLTKIPVLPISYGDALPLLRALGGPVAPPDWRGALPITYHLGPGPARVHLKLEFNWNMVPVYDVIARMPGSQHPDEWVIRGNHHDAWVNGANDPISGLVAVLEEARAIGELAKSGWTPKRTIIYAAWDGEEAGLLGSTEWVETHADELRANGVVYINSDTNSRGFLDAGGSHTLETLDQRRWRATCPIRSGTSRCWTRLRAREAIAGEECRGAEGSARARADPARCARLGLGLHAVPAAHRRRGDQHRLRRRGRRRFVSLDVRLVRSLHALRRSEFRLRRRAGEDDRTAGAAARRTPTCCRSS